ncbi:MAG TPA: VOC family protein [Hanamia sp.]
MLTDIHPKLPMRNKAITKDYYLNELGFENFGSADFDGYLMVQMDNIQIHFFEFKELDPKESYGQVYIRTDDIEKLYHSFMDKKIEIHPAGNLQTKLWGQKKISLLDPDNNLLTFGQSIHSNLKEYQYQHRHCRQEN